MGRNKSPERIKLEAIMEKEDRWWDRDELFSKWYPSVPPNVTTRAAEKSYKRTGSTQRTKDVSQGQLQRIGAKHIFNQILGAMRQYNRIEERRRNGVVEVRLVPEEVSTRFERYFSILVITDETDYSLYDPHGKVLLLSLRTCREMSDDDLQALFRWSQLHSDDDVTFVTAALLAKKVLNERQVDRILEKKRAVT